MKKYQALLYSLVLLSFIGCKAYNYAPLPDENSMFTKKGQLSVQASTNIRFYQGQAAYSPLKGLGFTYGFSGVLKGAGTGYSHGINLQHYGVFRPQGNLHYYVGLGFALGQLNNSVIKSGRGEFYYGINEQVANSKYSARALSTGLYWSLRDDNTQIGFHLDIRSARYSSLQFIRTELDNHPKGYNKNMSNKGDIIPRTIGSFCFSIKSTSESGLFYMKESFGFRTCDSRLSLYDMNPNARYEKGYAPYSIPYIIFNVQLGMNIDQLYRRKK